MNVPGTPDDRKPAKEFVVVSRLVNIAIASMVVLGHISEVGKPFLFTIWERQGEFTKAAKAQEDLRI